MADTDISIGHQAGVSVIAVFVLDWAKRSNLPFLRWINNNTETLNKLLSIGIALGTSVGLKIVSHTGDWSTGGQIVIAFPALPVIIDTLMHAAGQFGVQESLHKILGNHVVVKQLLDKVNNIERSLASIERGRE